MKKTFFRKMVGVLFLLIVFPRFFAVEAVDLSAAKVAIETAVDRDQKQVNVTVKTIEAAGQLVSVMVLRPHMPAHTLADISDHTIAEIVAATSQGVLNEKGTVTLPVDMRLISDGGYFTIKVGVADVRTEESARTASFYYPSDNDLAAALEALNGTNSSILDGIIRKYCNQTPILNILLSQTYEEKKLIILENIIKYRENRAEKKWPNLSAFYEDFNSAMHIEQRKIDALAAVNSANREKMAAVLERYNDVYLLNLTGEYLTLGKNEVNKALVGRNFVDIADVVRTFQMRIDEISSPKGSGGSSGNKGGGSHTVTIDQNLINAVTQSATDAMAASDEFDDLDGVEWAKESIAYLKIRGIINGSGNNKFLPDQAVTREEFVKMIVCAFDLKEIGEGTLFSDVGDAWYTQYIKIAEAHGIISGNDNGTFGIGKKITRQDMAVMLYRARQATNKNCQPDSGQTTFNDMKDIDDYAKEAVGSLSKRNIIKGIENGNFAPYSNALRAQAATVIYRAIIDMNQ